MPQPSRDQFNRLTAAIPGVVYQFQTMPDGRWVFVYLSPGIQELYEVSPAEAYADHNAVTDCLLPEDREGHRRSVEEAMRTLSRWTHEHRIRTRSGKLKWVRGQAVPERQPDGSVVWNGILIDVTERRLAEEALAESENRFRRVTSMTSDLVYSCRRGDDGYFRVGWMGGNAGRLFGVSTEEMLGMGCWRGFVLPEDRPLFEQHVTRLAPGQSGDTVMRVRHRDGLVRYLRSFAQVEADPDKSGRHLLYGAVQDITDRKVLEQELERQAHTDFLTGVANRGHFFELAEQELARVQRYRHPLSLVMLDLDHFKEVNDTHGHEVGDRVLEALAATCRHVLREIDVVGRMGGEEFAILLPETAGPQAFEVAERLREAIALASIDIGAEQPLRVTASLGVATYVEADQWVDTLLRRADRALYEAKRLGRNSTCQAREA